MAQASDFAAEIIVARRIFFEAIEAVNSRDAIRVRTGLLLADLAVESILKAVLRFYEKDIPEASRFAELLGSVKAAPGRGGPKLDYLRSRVEPLRSMRNAVMHEGRAQVPEEAQREVARARESLSRLVRDVFYLDFVNLHLGDFVRSPLLRHLLREADATFAAKTFGVTLAVCVAVHNQLMGGWGSYVRELFWIDRARKPIEQEDARRDDLTFSLSAGVYLPDLKKFRDVTEGAVAHVNARGHINGIAFINRRNDAPEQDARFALDFVGGLVLQVEQRFGADLPRWLAETPDPAGYCRGAITCKPT